MKKRRVGLGATGLVAAVALACAACTDHGEVAARPAARPNVILISIDTLRADRLGCYGYDRPTSPAIDRLAARGVLFARTFSESSWTLPSTMTLMTGLHPSAHGVINKERVLNGEIPLLAEILRQAGYRTAGLTGGGLVAGTWGFDRGFDRYEDRGSRGFHRVLAQARDQIAAYGPDERYFLFLHAYDVHAPYDSPDPYAAMFRTRPQEDHVDTRLRNDEHNEMKLTAGQMRFLSDQYDAGIRAADDLLGTFFSWLEQRGELADTIVVVTSDHGEEFGEHGSVGHGMKLYVESLRIPLIVVAPGVKPGVEQSTAGLSDVMPTLLDLLGLASPFTHGRSLAPLLRQEGVGDVDRIAFSELDEPFQLRSALRGSHHLIVNLRLETQTVLFDLRSDPTESRPRAIGEDERRLERTLKQHLASLSPVRPPQVSEIPGAVAERLRALGYGDVRADAERPSPADALGDAAAAGDASAIARLLDDGADVNTVDRRGHSPLFRAAETARAETVKLLLARGAKPDGPGRTPLMAAAASGDESILTLLLDRGVEVNAKDWTGVTALHRAAAQGRPEAVAVLLARGADPKVADQQGLTALILAAGAGHGEAARLLVAGGADVHARTRDGTTALIAAARNGDPSTVSTLLEHGADTAARALDGTSALLEAARANRRAAVDLLIRGGADPNTRAPDRSTALMVAAQEQALDAAEALLQHGADVKARGEERTTALHIAADEDDERLVTLLLAHGANPSARDEDGETPLSLAEGYDPRVVEILRAAVEARKSDAR